MESKSFNDYEIAKISSDEESRIKELEQTLRDEQNKEVVLIAYQQKSENPVV